MGVAHSAGWGSPPLPGISSALPPSHACERFTPSHFFTPSSSTFQGQLPIHAASVLLQAYPILLILLIRLSFTFAPLTAFTQLRPASPDQSQQIFNPRRSHCKDRCYLFSTSGAALPFMPIHPDDLLTPTSTVTHLVAVRRLYNPFDFLWNFLPTTGFPSATTSPSDYNPTG